MWHSFSRLVWIYMGRRTGFMEMQIHHCHFRSGAQLHYRWPPAHAAGPLDVFDFIMFRAHGPSSRRVDIGKCVRFGARMVTLRIVTPLIQSLHPLMRSTDGSTHNSTSLICKVSSPLHLASRRAPLIGNSLLTLIRLMFKCNRKPLIQGNGLFCLLW